ncbi:GNAT family N-acetyltransferase [Robertmurraya massiliosenegalensis]|uniref:GNAT family N-acetyltransferase n=1 Tax=Robertmurraya TaxID=2837507 RepID=UPI0039A50DEF
MGENITIEQLNSIEEHIEELSELLVKVVDGGASIGFLPPLQRTVAEKFWRNVLNPDVILFVAKINNEIAGTVQLHLCSKQNGKHRAEIAKLMTHPYYRRNGVARHLMKITEERAKEENRSLLVLDTREGDPSNILYNSLGFNQAGKIPYFAQSGNGELEPTIIYYKTI